MVSDESYIYTTIYNRICKDIYNKNKEIYSRLKKLVLIYSFIILLKDIYIYNYNLTDLVQLGKMVFI